MGSFYTNVSRQSNNLLVRGVDENGHRFSRKVKYKPYLFTPQQGPVEGEYRTIEGKPVGKMEFNSMSEAREFLKQYDDVSGMDIYGLTDFTYLYINDHYRKQISYDPALIISVGIDIEVSSEGGFPDIASADKEVTAITLSHKGHKYVYGLPPSSCADYTPHGPNITYHSCKTEQELLFKFIQKWEQLNPDCVTGWNIEFFDIPYLVNRITKVCTPEDAKRLSPWKTLREYEVEVRGRKNQAFTPVGVNVLDYINLYKKFTYTQQESYRLDHIAYVELGERKLDFSEYSNLEQLYKENYQKFIEYNIKDVELIDRLEDKMKLIELVYAMAFDAKINFEDTLGSVKQWDVIVHNFLLERKIVIPQFKEKQVNRELVGGYVKEPKTGLSKWVVSLDLTSLYPHLIMGYNMSPDTYIGKETEFPSVDELISGKFPSPRDYSYAANGTFYKKNVEGFLPALMKYNFNIRAETNKILKEKKLIQQQIIEEKKHRNL
jgi:DNA polymerase elongation subunit (family B)